jgi:hypothetical protein
MVVFAAHPRIWAALLLTAVTCTSSHADTQEKRLIGCWSAAYEYDSVHSKDGTPSGSARLCSRKPSLNNCGADSYLDVTYCFDGKGDAYGSEVHCSATPKRICHGTDGLSGRYGVQGSRLDFFQRSEDDYGDDVQELGWSCSFSISGPPEVLEFADCDVAMKTFFRDCDFGQKIEEYQNAACETAPR